MTRVRFYDKYYVPGGRLLYSVISAMYRGKWIFVRHHLRNTWEICGGHIEDDESSDEAARREVVEETGAGEFTLECIATYSVERKGEKNYGRLYFADVTRLDRINDTSEIAEIRLMDTLPQALTYPDIQTHLFRKTLEFLGNKKLI